MRRLTMVCVLAGLAACSGGAPFPAGWQPLAGTTGTWVNGTAAGRQTYAYGKERYAGTLQELAQREIVNNALHKAKFVNSDVFAPCPGIAAIATFAGGGQTLQDAFSVEGGNAVVVRYTRPATAPDDPAAVAAMQRALCVAPA